MTEPTVIIKRPADAAKLSEYLNKHYIRKEEITGEKSITNTRIGGGKDSGISGGSYHIPDAEYDDFLKLIYRDLIQKQGENLRASFCVSGCFEVRVATHFQTDLFPQNDAF